VALAPAWLFIEAYAQSGFCYYLVCEKGVGRMDAAQTRIADQSLIASRAEYSIAARHIQTSIHDAPRTFHGMILRGKNLRRPQRAMINALGPILGN
jgi:hypothetical protein